MDYKSDRSPDYSNRALRFTQGLQILDYRWITDLECFCRRNIPRSVGRHFLLLCVWFPLSVLIVGFVPVST